MIDNLFLPFVNSNEFNSDQNITYRIFFALPYNNTQYGFYIKSINFDTSMIFLWLKSTVMHILTMKPITTCLYIQSFFFYNIVELFYSLLCCP